MDKLRIIMLMFLLLFICNSHSQTYVHSGKDNFKLRIDSDTFEIFKTIKYINPDKQKQRYNDSIDIILHHWATRAYSIISEGRVMKKNNKITCYDPELKRYYVFILLNDSTLLAAKHTALFVKGNILKLE